MHVLCLSECLSLGAFDLSVLRLFYSPTVKRALNFPASFGYYGRNEEYLPCPTPYFLISLCPKPRTQSRR